MTDSGQTNTRAGNKHSYGGRTDPIARTVEALDTTASKVMELPLESVVEAWGIERVQDVTGQIAGPQGWVAVLDGAGGARVLPATQVLAANPDHMLDLLPGGVDAVYVEATTAVGDLPEHRPLLVRQGSEVLGLIGGESMDPKRARMKRMLRLPCGGADAAMAAWAAVKHHRDTYRRKGIALVLDIQPSRVEGDGLVVRDSVDILLEEALELIQRANGGTGVHLVLGQGQSGLWIGIETHGSYFPAACLFEMLEDGPSEDPTTLALRRVRDKVRAQQGHMKVTPTRTGTRFMISLPSPEA